METGLSICLKDETGDEFKSYYVVWKPTENEKIDVINESLNRTM